MPVIVIEPDELQSLINESVQSALEAKAPEIIQKATRKQWLNTDELMELTGWSRPTLQRLRDRKELPYHQDGQRILYKRSDVDEFLERKRIGGQRD